MEGKKFGKWLVLSFVDVRSKSYAYLCRCECGKEAVLHGPSLRHGKTKSCVTCNNRKMAEENKLHDLSRTSTYKIWSAMKQRIKNPKCKAYNRYGGRGIKMCPRWEIFENFLEDMGIRPKGLDLDRIDNNGDYCKENCRWISHKENCQNRFY